MTFAEAGINDICLFVPDMEEAVAFYRDKMGLEVQFQRERYYTIFRFEGTALTLWDQNEVSEAAIPGASAGGSGRGFMIAVRVGEPDEVDRLYAELTGRGVEAVSPPADYHWKCRAAYLADPYQNVWEIFSFTDPEQPGREENQRY